MIVKDILSQKGNDVFSMTPEAALEDVVRELSTRRIGAVIIRDGEQIAGILSERDVVRHVADHGAAALTMPASSAMTRKVETCGIDDFIDDVMARMTTSRFRHMPVLHQGRLAGIVSIGDVVKLKIEQVVRETDDMRAYISQTS